MTTEPPPEGASLSGTSPAGPKPSALRLVVRTALGLALAFALVTLAGRFYRAELETIGRRFVENLGYPGMFVGTFIADAFTFPLPSWFYFVLAVASKASPVRAIVAVTLGSLLGGSCAYVASARLSDLRLFKSRITAARERLAPLLSRHGAWAMVLMALVPVPFSVSCYVAGSYRIGPRLFGLYLALRVPRLIVFYLLVRLGF